MEINKRDVGKLAQNVYNTLDVHTSLVGCRPQPA
jgi:hypothetical protein